MKGMSRLHGATRNVTPMQPTLKFGDSFNRTGCNSCRLTVDDCNVQFSGQERL
jgi:hypothetical protein